MYFFSLSYYFGLVRTYFKFIAQPRIVFLAIFLVSDKHLRPPSCMLCTHDLVHVINNVKIIGMIHSNVYYMSSAMLQVAPPYIYSLTHVQVNHYLGALLHYYIPLAQINLVRIISYYWQGSHPTWKTWNFLIYFFRPGKCLEFVQKVGKTWNFNSKPGKKWNFKISCFHINLSRFLYKTFIYIYVISKLSKQKHCDSKPNETGISLLLPENNLENT